jgi:hypothetical protein
MNSNIQIEIIIAHFVKQGAFEDKKLFVFGMNGFVATICRTVRDMGYCLVAILDNNPNKHGSEVFGLTVHSPSIIADPFDDSAVILIASKYYDEMASQLEGIGYSRHIHIMKLLDIDAIDGPDFISEQILDSCIENAKRGMNLYTELLKASGNDLIVFLSPVSSIGDIFLLGLYFNKFLSKMDIDKYVLIIPGNAGAGIAKTYGIKNVTVVSPSDAADLIAYKMLAGRKGGDIRILHSGYLHQRIVCNIIMHRNMTWLENYRQFLFGFCKDEPFLRRRVNHNPVIAKQLLEINKLTAGNTVILSPYAQTMAALSDVFWTKLAKKLKEAGYCVSTNIAGEEREIEGTVPLNFSLNNADAVLEQAGYFIALRSGLCDVVSMANCKKIILYTQEVFECIKVIDFYSINKMGLCSDAIEIEVSYNHELDIDTVMSTLCV